jgi:hypothetical protein
LFSSAPANEINPKLIAIEKNKLIDESLSQFELVPVLIISSSNYALKKNTKLLLLIVIF